MRLSTCLLALVLLAAACVPTPPAPPAPRTGTDVAASFGRTWDATIDVFAENGISIETLDRSSGLIVPAGRSFAPGVFRQEALRYADCGKSMWGDVVLPFTVKYNVVVRGDSTRSHVVVRAFYRGMQEEYCASRGLFESEAEANIKGKAEGTTGALASSPTRCGEGSRADRVGDDWIITLEHTTDGNCQVIPCVIAGQGKRGTPADAIALCEADHSLWRARRP